MNVWLLHGLFGTVAVFIVYPLGILSRRPDLPFSRISHSVTQSIGIAFTLIGGGIGLWRNGSISYTHQYLGLAMMAGVYCQLGLGIISRELDSRSRAKRYLRWLHLVQGFGSLALGWFCFVTGLLFASWGTKTVVVLGLMAAVEVVAIPIFHMLVPVKAGYTPLRNVSEMSVPVVQGRRGIRNMGSGSRDSLDIA